VKHRIGLVGLDLVALLAGLPALALAQDHSPEGYLDDRSTPEAVINSYYDAVNKRGYSRACSYWEPGAAESELPPFESFVAGYADTASVAVTLGEVVVPTRRKTV